MNGGICARPGVCTCLPGFVGTRCQRGLLFPYDFINHAGFRSQWQMKAPDDRSFITFLLICFSNCMRHLFELSALKHSVFQLDKSVFFWAQPKNIFVNEALS